MSVTLPPNSSGTQVRTVTTGGFDTFCSVLSDGVNPAVLGSVLAPGAGIVSRIAEVAVSSALVDGNKATYSACSTGLLPTAAATTGLMILSGSASKTVRLTHVIASGTQATAAVYLDWQVSKFSTAATGGTPTTVAGTPHDSNSPAATASVQTFVGAGPTLGTLVGIIATGKTFAPITGTPAVTPGIFDVQWGNRPAQAPVLRGVAQQIAVTINSVTPANAPNVDISIEWTEE